MGLIKTALKTAVAVKTAHVVHDRIQQRQSAQFAEARQVAPDEPLEFVLYHGPRRRPVHVSTE
jgi:hypothetical protein